MSIDDKGINSVEILIYRQENHANEEGKCTSLIFNHHKLRAIRECVVVEHDTCYIDVDKELTKSFFLRTPLFWLGKDLTKS